MLSFQSTITFGLLCSIVVESRAVRVNTAVPVKTTSLKKGLGFNTNSYLNGFGNSLAWSYNWYNSPAGTIPAGVEYIPMLWGSDATGWSAAATTAIKNGSKHLLA